MRERGRNGGLCSFSISYCKDIVLDFLFQQPGATLALPCLHQLPVNITDEFLSPNPELNSGLSIHRLCTQASKNSQSRRRLFHTHTTTPKVVTGTNTSRTLWAQVPQLQWWRRILSGRTPSPESRVLWWVVPQAPQSCVPLSPRWYWGEPWDGQSGGRS